MAREHTAAVVPRQAAAAAIAAAAVRTRPIKAAAAGNKTARAQAPAGNNDARNQHRSVDGSVFVGPYRSFSARIC